MVSDEMRVVECGERRDDEKGGRKEGLGGCSYEKLEMRGCREILSGPKWINSNQNKKSMRDR